jgi:hypothetical protein
MQISFVGTEQDFVNSQKTHAWRRYSPERAQLQKILSPILGIIFIVTGVLVYRRGSNLAFLGTLIEVACGLYVLLATPVIGPLMYRRAFRRRQDGTPHENTMTIAEDYIECDCTGRSHVRLEWRAIKGFLESPTTFLLYTSQATFLAIPKRALSETQSQELLSTLNMRGVPLLFPKKAPKTTL